MKPDYLLSSALHEPTNALAYMVSHELTALYPGRAIVHGGTSAFDFDEYVKAGLCRVTPRVGVLEHLVTYWRGTGEGLRHQVKHGWYDVVWTHEGSEHKFNVVLLSWYEDGCESRNHWIVCDIRKTGEAFFEAVCEWASVVRGEVLVFEDGDWEKDKSLFQAIKNAGFDNLTLPDSLRHQIQTDFAQFFASRDVYRRYNLPWKRGVLLVGPPGNGKTHTIKALVNWLGKPCLYVKSFKSRYETEQHNVRSVFERARQTTPCLLILEDLDSLLDDKNRAFFLNELDGFATNDGIVVIATTNHPERLDVAILERPSRFDRKYHFDLPAAPERLAYIENWNRTLAEEMRVSHYAVAPIVEATEGFSFAYLKELFVSAMMRWINVDAPGSLPMDAALREQAALLREQMHTMNTTVVPHTPSSDPE